MSVAFKQLRVYVRASIVVAVLVAVVLVLFMNRGHTVSLWFFGLTDTNKPVNVVWLMLCTAASTLVSWWGLSLGWGLWRELKEAHSLRMIRDAAGRLDERAEKLDVRERRLDENVQKAIGEGPSTHNDEDE